MTDKQIEALKLALECVEAWDRGCDRDTYWRDIEAAVTAIKEALTAQPASGLNPLWVATHPDGLTTPQPAQQEPQQPVQQGCMRCNTPKKCALYGCLPLTWPAEQPAQPQQEPVALQPLTDEELCDALRSCPHDTVENLRVRWLYAKDFARAIEAAHGITGEQSDRELMQQALDALNHVNVQDRVQIITALRERLAQPEQEPVAWIHGDEYGDACHWVGGRMPPAGTKLYTTPPQRKPPPSVQGATHEQDTD